MSLLLGTPIYSDANATYTPTFSGGSWAAGLPLTNLQDRRLSKVARASSAALADTKFDIDLKTARQVRILALVGHNISTAGKVRVRGFSALPIFDAMDLSGFTGVGTVTRSAAAFTGTDGVPMDLVGDNDAGAAAYHKATIVFTGNGQKEITVKVRKGSAPAATGALFALLDVTAAAYRLEGRITWSGSVPSVAIGSAHGALQASVNIVDDEYYLTFLTDAVTAANTHRIEVYGAGVGPANETGNIYVRDIVAYDAVTDQLVYDAGLKDAWPAVFPAGSIPTYHPSYATSKFTAEDAVGFPLPFVNVPSAPYSARYWRWEVQDTANAAGYVQIGRLVMAYGEACTVAPKPGLKIGWDTNSTRTDTDAYSAVYASKGIRRTVTFAFDNVDEGEAFVRSFDIQRRLGITGQLFFVYDHADVELMPRRSFLAVQRDLSPMESPVFSRFGVPFSLVEEL
jgi:hypothetical protein